MSFGSLGTTITTSGVPPVDLSKPAVSSPPPQPSVESPLEGLKACSPEVKPVVQSPPANIFAGSSSVPEAKKEASSIFGGSSFGSALGAALTPNSSASLTFGSPAISSPPVAPVASPAPILSSSQPQSASIFGPQSPPVTTPAPSLFGSLALGSGDASKATPTSPPAGLFSSMVKPDQSVFSPASTGGFGSSGSGNQTSNVFGSSAAPTSPSIFGSSNPAPTSNIFASQATTTQPATSSMFGQSATTNNGTSGATGGSLFSQSSFSSSPSTNIFGAAQPASASPFGGSSVFGAPQNPQQASSGSIFGGQSTFASQPSTGSVFGGSAAPSPFGSASVFGGGATFSSAPFGGGFGASAAPSNVFGQQSAPTFGGQATFGSPKSNIFGQQSAAGQSNNLFEQLGSQQGGNMFGSLAQNTQPAQQQQPPQAGFGGSAFSSWR